MPLSRAGQLLSLLSESGLGTSRRRSLSLVTWSLCRLLTSACLLTDTTDLDP